MKLKKGNMWDRFGKVDLFCITINGTFKANGELVMGAGIAKEAKERMPGIERIISTQFRTYCMREPYSLPAVLASSKSQMLGLFQVKHHFAEPASLELIKRSAVQLFRYIASYPKMTVCLNFPGIGNGKLNKDEVFPIVNLLPNNVEVWEYEN